MTIDIASMADLFARPGADTRQWFSYGIVDTDSESSRSVRFDDDYGVLIDVTLQPSGISVPCRVGSMAAGSGEGEYSPFGPGDEVVVGIPSGDEREGCVILQRLSNAKDSFPKEVAGMDVTNNDVTFKRVKTPYVFETGASYLVRSALTGASMSIDPTGNVILASGDGHTLSLSAAVISLMESTGDAGVQIDPSEKTATIFAGTSSLIVRDMDTVFLTAGTFGIGTAGMPASGHAVTLEQVVSLLANFLCALCMQNAFTGGPFALSSWAIPGAAQGLLNTLFTAVFQGAIAPTPIGASGVPGGDLTGMSAAILAMQTALKAQLPDPAALGLPAPILPGIGKQGLMF